jgi:hypothetical protein
MTELALRLRLPWIVAWIVGFFIGQYVVLAAGWGNVISSVFILWRMLIVLVVYVITMRIVDLIWKASTETRSVAREFVDALILGAFIAVSIAS